MPLTPEQAFKVGFLCRCAEEGLTTQEIENRVKAAAALQKCAAPPMPTPGGSLSDLVFGPARYIGSKGLEAGEGVVRGLASAIPSLLSLGTTAAVAAPIGLGAGVGYLGAKATTSNRDAVEDAKRDEIIGEYERLSDEARRRTRLKRLQQHTGRKVLTLLPERH